MGRMIDADVFKKYITDGWSTNKDRIRTAFGQKVAKEITDGFLKDIDEQPTVNEWIPIKDHAITEAEKEEYADDVAYVFDCQMPEGGQEILISTKDGYVHTDVNFVDDTFGTDSGYDWITEIAAWMPLPEPYKEAEHEDEV